MSRHRISVEFYNNVCVYVRGYGTRDLLTELRGRAPVWATISRAWVTTPETAKDLIAIAERRGWDVTILEPNPDSAGLW